MPIWILCFCSLFLQQGISTSLINSSIPLNQLLTNAINRGGKLLKTMLLDWTCCFFLLQWSEHKENEEEHGDSAEVLDCGMCHSVRGTTYSKETIWFRYTPRSVYWCPKCTAESSEKRKGKKKKKWVCFTYYFTHISTWLFLNKKLFKSS